LAITVKRSGITVKDSAIKIIGSNTATEKERENVKNTGELHFEAWPMPAGNRERKSKLLPFRAFDFSADHSHTLAAEVRRVKLSGLPTECNIVIVTAIVWGGNIQEIRYTPGQTVADALFLKHEDCNNYFSATGNGIQYPGDANRFIAVEMMEPEHNERPGQRLCRTECYSLSSGHGRRQRMEQGCFAASRPRAD
jgi:hypothetical protein